MIKFLIKIRNENVHKYVHFKYIYNEVFISVHYDYDGELMATKLMLYRENEKIREIKFNSQFPNAPFYNNPRMLILNKKLLVKMNGINNQDIVVLFNVKEMINEYCLFQFKILKEFNVHNNAYTYHKNHSVRYSNKHGYFLSKTCIGYVFIDENTHKIIYKKLSFF